MSRAAASSTSPRWLPRLPKGVLAGQALTYLHTSRTFRRRFVTWTMLCCSRIGRAQRSRRAAPWPTLSSPIFRPTLMHENRSHLSFEQLPRNVKRIRQEKGLTQEPLAEVPDFSQRICRCA